MKRLKHNVIAERSKIFSAIQEGTTFYRASLEDVKQALHDSKANIILQQCIETYGWGCIDFEKGLFGSGLVGDNLYICETDGYDIDVDGEEVDPESAFDEYGPEKLSSYIQDATPKEITRMITPYELIENYDMNEIAVDLISAGRDLSDIIKALDDIGELDRYL